MRWIVMPLIALLLACVFCRIEPTTPTCSLPNNLADTLEQIANEIEVDVPDALLRLRYQIEFLRTRRDSND